MQLFIDRSGGAGSIAEFYFQLEIATPVKVPPGAAAPFALPLDTYITYSYLLLLDQLIYHLISNKS